jgi:GMP synthase
LEVSGFGASFSRYARIGKAGVRYAIILPGNKKSTFYRASFLPAELVNDTPFLRALFLWTF